MKQERVLVTGGLGFLGSFLVEELLQRKCFVTVIDNKISNVVEEDFFNKHENFRFIGKSIIDTDLSDVGEVSKIFHLASVVGPSGILKYAAKMGKMIVDDSSKLYNFSLKKNALLVDISTSEIYGHTDILYENSFKVFPGDYQIRTEYGAGKMLSEIMTVNFGKINKDFKYHIIRPFNITGERQKPDNGFVLPRFVISALTGQPITVFGSGESERAFTSVKDIRDIIITIAYGDKLNDIWNIGNPDNKIKIIDLAKKVCSIVEQKGIREDFNIIKIDPKEIHGEGFAEVVDKIPYIEKIKSNFNINLKYSYDDIISEIVDFYNVKINNGYYFDVIKCKQV